MGTFCQALRKMKKIRALLGDASINGACSNDQPPYDDD